MTFQPCGIWVHIYIDVDDNHSTGDDKPVWHLTLRQTMFVVVWDHVVMQVEEGVIVVTVVVAVGVVVVGRDFQETP